MTIKQVFLLTLITLFLAACNNNHRQRELDKREQAISKRELELAVKTADYSALIRMRDSLLTQKSDSIIIQRWPKEMPGKWNAKIQCRESNCTDYVVGDQRSETWAFESDSTGIFTKIFNNDKLLRIYAAQVDSTAIRLNYQSDSTASRSVAIRVVLTKKGIDLIQGTQTVSVNNKCTANFSVELLRSSNP